MHPLTFFDPISSFGATRRPAGNQSCDSDDDDDDDDADVGGPVRAVELPDTTRPVVDRMYGSLSNPRSPGWFY